MRRNFLRGTALSTAALVLASCAASPGGTQTTVDQIIATVQVGMTAIPLIATGVSMFIPNGPALLATVTPFMNAAYSVFNAMVPTMTTSAAATSVQSILDSMTAAVKAISDATATAGPGSPLAKWQPQVQQAQAIMSLLAVFVMGVKGTVGAVAPTITTNLGSLYIRQVKQ